MTQGDYRMDSQQCLSRLMSLMSDYMQHKPKLLYAALELRFCIERTLFEYIVFIKSTELSKKIEKLYSAKDLKSKILEEEPNFFRKIDFLNTLGPHIGVDGEVLKPDLDLISSVYGTLGNYLHAPKRPNKTWENLQWWQSLEEAIDKGTTHLLEIHKNPVGYIDLNDRGKDLFEKFIDQEMSIEELNKEIKLHYEKNS